MEVSDLDKRISLHSKKEGDVLVLAVSGDLTTTTYEFLMKQISKALEPKDKFVLLDFEELVYLSSAGLKLVLEVSNKITDRSGTLIICSLNEQVSQAFVYSGFDQALNIEDTREKALKAFKGNSEDDSASEASESADNAGAAE